MVLDAALLNTQCHKAGFKVKMEQSSERSSALTSAFWSPSTTVAYFTFIYNYLFVCYAFSLLFIPGQLWPRGKVPFTSQIDLFKNYSYFIGPVQKKTSNNYTKRFKQAYNECDSLTSRHEISIDRLKYCFNQLIPELFYFFPYSTLSDLKFYKKSVLPVYKF